MPVIKMNTPHKKGKKKSQKVVVVIKSFHSAEETGFPEKIKKAKEILTQAGFRPF